MYTPPGLIAYLRGCETTFVHSEQLSIHPMGAKNKRVGAIFRFDNV
jgi:hypothetical protein